MTFVGEIEVWCWWHEGSVALLAGPCRLGTLHPEMCLRTTAGSIGHEQL